MRIAHQLIRRVMADSRASLPVELAVILPLVFALIFAMVDASRLLLARSLADALAVALSEDIKLETPQAVRAGLTVAAIEGELAALVPVFAGTLIDASRVRLTVQSYDDLAALAGGSPNAGAAPGAAGGITAYRLDYTVPLITPFVNYLYSSGDVTGTATVVVKNGP